MKVTYMWSHWLLHIITPLQLSSRKQCVCVCVWLMSNFIFQWVSCCNFFFLVQVWSSAEPRHSEKELHPQVLHPWRSRGKGLVRVKRDWIIPPIRVSENSKQIPETLVQVNAKWKLFTSDSSLHSSSLFLLRLLSWVARSVIFLQNSSTGLLFRFLLQAYLAWPFINTNPYSI